MGRQIGLISGTWSEADQWDLSRQKVACSNRDSMYDKSRPAGRIGPYEGLGAAPARGEGGGRGGSAPGG